MADFDIIPKMRLPGEGLAKNSGEIMERLLKKKIEDAKLAEDQRQADLMNQYRMGELDIARQELPGKLDLQKAQADYYRQGGRGGGVGFKDQMALMQQAVRDNPGIDMERANQITNAWLSGDETLPDGSPVPKPSGNAMALMDRVSKGRTTAGALNTILNARGAEKEVKTLSSISNEWLKPYGTTYFDKSPQQIIDTFKNDDESQKRLGKFIAAQALQYDIAPARTRLAGATPGVTLTNELVKVGMQNIKAKYPRLSAKARQFANDYINEALEKGFQARQDAGVSASSAFKGGNKGTNKEESNGYTTFMTPDNQMIEVKSSQADDFENKFPDHKRVSG